MREAAERVVERSCMNDPLSSDTLYRSDGNNRPLEGVEKSKWWIERSAAYAGAITSTTLWSRSGSRNRRHGEPLFIRAARRRSAESRQILSDRRCCAEHHPCVCWAALDS